MKKIMKVSKERGPMVRVTRKGRWLRWTGYPVPEYWGGDPWAWADAVLPMPEIVLRPTVHHQTAEDIEMLKLSRLKPAGKPESLGEAVRRINAIDIPKLDLEEYQPFTRVGYEVTFAGEASHRLFEAQERKRQFEMLCDDYTTNQRLNPGSLPDLSALRIELIDELNRLAGAVGEQVELARQALLMPLYCVDDYDRARDWRGEHVLGRLKDGVAPLAGRAAHELRELLASSPVHERLAHHDQVWMVFVANEPITAQDVVTTVQAGLSEAVEYLEPLLERAGRLSCRLSATEGILQAARAGELVKDAPMIPPKKWEKGEEATVMWKGSSTELGHVLNRWREALMEEKYSNPELVLGFDPESQRAFTRKVAPHFKHTSESLRTYMQQEQHNPQLDPSLDYQFKSLRRALEPYFIRRG